MAGDELQEVRGVELRVAGVMEGEPDLIAATAVNDREAPVVAGAHWRNGDERPLGDCRSLTDFRFSSKLELGLAIGNRSTKPNWPAP